MLCSNGNALTRMSVCEHSCNATVTGDSSYIRQCCRGIQGIHSRSLCLYCLIRTHVHMINSMVADCNCMHFISLRYMYNLYNLQCAHDIIIAASTIASLRNQQYAMYSRCDQECCWYCYYKLLVVQATSVTHSNCSVYMYAIVLRFTYISHISVHIAAMLLLLLL
jgi:hypothetical protein